MEGGAGRSAWDPRLLISLWVYAYSEGVSSAREVSRLCEYDPAHQWLAGLDEINHHTLSDFRVAHKEALDDLFKKVLGLLSAEGLITLERVMHDGTKVKASAGGGHVPRGGAHPGPPGTGAPTGGADGRPGHRGVEPAGGPSAGAGGA